MVNQKTRSLDIDNFSRQVSAMRDRIARLIHSAYGEQITDGADNDLLIPAMCKEMGVASEELQVAIEEVQRQNDVLTDALETSLTAQRQYQDLFNFLPNALLVTTPNGVVFEANQAAADLLNVPTHFLIGKPLSVFVQESYRPFFRSELLRQASQTQTKEWRLFLEPREQAPIEVVCLTSGAYDPTGKVLMMRWLLRKPAIPILPQSSKLQATAGLLQEYPAVSYARGSTILPKPQITYLVMQGLVKITTLTENKEEVLIGLLGEGMPFGQTLSSLSEFRAIALSDVQLIEIPMSALAETPMLGQMLFSRASQRLQQTERLLAIAGQRRVKSRLYELLRLLKEEVGELTPQGTRLGVRLTHEDLANACCSTRVTITRLLGQFQHKGKIRFDDKYHIILVD